MCSSGAEGGDGVGTVWSEQKRIHIKFGDFGQVP